MESIDVSLQNIFSCCITVIIISFTLSISEAVSSEIPGLEVPADLPKGSSVSSYLIDPIPQINPI